MTMNDYFHMWDPFSNASLPLKIGMMAFWNETQAAFNASCRKLFIEDSQGMDLDFVVDDDKIIFNTMKSQPDGLKVVRHVFDNRNGHVFHTTVYTFSGFVIGIEAERSEGDNNGSATKRLIMAQLRPSHGIAGPPNLTNVKIYSDLAY